MNKKDLPFRLFKRGKIYYIEIERNIRRSLKTSDIKIALKRAFSLYEEYKKLKFIKITGSITLELFLNEYISKYSKILAERTIELTIDAVKKFSIIVSKKSFLNHIKPKDLYDYIELRKEQEIKPSTINIEIRHIKSFFTKAVELGYLEKNPFQHVKQLKMIKRIPNFLMPDQIQIVRDIIDDEKWRNLFEFFIYTGGRRSEILSLTWRDITKDYIILRKTKNKKERKIPIHPELKNTIEEMRVNKNTIKIGKIFNGFNEKYVTKKFKKYFEKAGFKELRLHDLRHTFASILIMSGVDIYTVSQLLGHKEVTTTQIYAHLCDKHLKEAIAKLKF